MQHPHHEVLQLDSLTGTGLLSFAVSSNWYGRLNCVHTTLRQHEPYEHRVVPLYPQHFPTAIRRMLHYTHSDGLGTIFHEDGGCQIDGQWCPASYTLGAIATETTVDLTHTSAVMNARTQTYDITRLQLAFDSRKLRRLIQTVRLLTLSFNGVKRD